MLYKVPSDPRLPLRGCASVILLLLAMLCFARPLVGLILDELGATMARAVVVLMVLVVAAALLWLSRELRRER